MRLVVTAFLIAPMLAPTYADARTPPLRCDSIQPGETVVAVARRLTGRAENRSEAWFRIVHRTRVIPKAAYNRVQAGWQACIPAERGLPRASVPGATPLKALSPAVPSRLTTAPASSIRAAPLAAAGGVFVPRPVSPPDAPQDWPLTLAFMCLGPAAFGAAIGFGWRGIERVMTRRRALTRELQQFADVFVSDFEKPLRIDAAAGRPVQARFRWRPRDRRLEILLAPGPGRRYPNLDDHRRNVEYDVERIADRLKAYPFERRPLRAEGAWVVIPFQFNPGPRTGASV